MSQLLTLLSDSPLWAWASSSPSDSQDPQREWQSSAGEMTLQPVFGILLGPKPFLKMLLSVYSHLTKRNVLPLWLTDSLNGQWFVPLIHSLLHFPLQHMVPSRGQPVKRGRGVILDPKVRLAILSLFSPVMPRKQHCDHRDHSTARGHTLSQRRWHLQDLSQNIVLTWSPFPWPVPVCGSLVLKGKLDLLIPSGDPGPMGPPGRHGHRGPKGEKGEKGRNMCHPQESRGWLSGSSTSPSLGIAGKHGPSFLV